MFAYELPLDPPCNEWTEYILPKKCKIRIEDVCQDILKKGDKTQYSIVYDIIYELIEDEIAKEQLEFS